MTTAALPVLVAGLAVWFSLVRRTDLPTVGIGLLVTWSAWRLFDRLMGPLPSPPLARMVMIVDGIGRYLLLAVLPDMVRSTGRVVREVLRPRLALHPVIIAVPLPGASPLGLIALAYGISLTPGQQIVSIDDERRVLYVHCFDAPDPEAMRTAIVDLYLRYLAEATRW